MIPRLLLLGIASFFVWLAMLGRSGPRRVAFERVPATDEMLITLI